MTPFQRIARKLTRALSVGSITTEQVAAVANGTDQTESHPIHQQIKAELNRYPRPRKNGHKATNDSHIWEE